MTPARAWRLAAAVILGLTLLSPGARAASGVRLLRTSAQEVLVRQAETLLTAELRAAGFTVEQRDQLANEDLRPQIESSADAIATVAIRPVSGGGAAEVWIADHLTGKLVIRRVDAVGATSEQAAADLALKAVELLRGSLLELKFERAGRAEPPPPPEVARFVQEAEPAGPRWAYEGVGLGLSLMLVRDSARMGVGWTPSVRLSYGGGRGWAIRANVAAYGSTHTLTSREGEARVRPLFAMGEFLWAFRSHARFQPYVIAGAGVQHIRVQGTGVSALFPGRHDTSTAPLGAGGAGLALRLAAHAALFLEASALYTTPATSITVAEVEVVRVGDFAAAISLGAASTF